MHLAVVELDKLALFPSAVDPSWESFGFFLCCKDLGGVVLVIVVARVPDLGALIGDTNVGVVVYIGELFSIVSDERGEKLIKKCTALLEMRLDRIRAVVADRELFQLRAVLGAGGADAQHRNKRYRSD
ncbi:hypothetical protein [Paracoccus versutus]